MEFAENGCLASFLETEDSVLPPEIQASFAIDIGKGLECLHSQDILHRDLKTDNILLGTYEVGTVRWRAPETFQDGYVYETPSDVFSYGSILWSISTRRKPYDDESNAFVVSSWIEKYDLETIPADCLFTLEISSCWVKDPKKRPTASDITRSLQEKKHPKSDFDPEPGLSDYETGNQLFLQAKYEESVPFNSAEKKGYPAASIKLALLFHLGIDGLFDLQDARSHIVSRLSDMHQWLEEKAKTKDADHLFNYYLFYYVFQLVQPDNDDSMNYLIEAADQGHPFAQRLISICYRNGLELSKNHWRSEKYLELSANQGDPQGQFELGLCHRRSKDLDLAFKLIKLSAEQGSPRAQNSIGFCYLMAIGVERNLELAFHFFQLSSEKGNREAKINLGFCYYHGIGTQKNPQMVFKMYEFLASKNDPRGQVGLGRCYQEGIGVEKDPEKCVKLYKLAGKGGDPDALSCLGHCFLVGIGVEKNLEYGFRYIKLAAARGSAVGQSNLGYCYERGFGTPKDPEMAFKFYKLSADQGHPDGQISLGEFYRDGIGIEKDEKMAFQLFLLAAEG